MQLSELSYYLSTTERLENIKPLVFPQFDAEMKNIKEENRETQTKLWCTMNGTFHLNEGKRKQRFLVDIPPLLPDSLKRRYFTNSLDSGVRMTCNFTVPDISKFTVQK